MSNCLNNIGSQQMLRECWDKCCDRLIGALIFSQNLSFGDSHENTSDLSKCRYYFFRKQKSNDYVITGIIIGVGRLESPAFFLAPL